MKNRRLASLIAVVALVGAACGGAATATPTATPTAAAATAAHGRPDRHAGADRWRPRRPHDDPSASAIDRADDSATGDRSTPPRCSPTAASSSRGATRPATGPSPRPTATTRGRTRSAATGSMATARGCHTATLLSDGRVLVAGGGPASWTGGAARVPRLGRAVRPEDRHVQPDRLDVDGTREPHRDAAPRRSRPDRRRRRTPSDHAVASAEIYDPKTGTFSPTGSMTAARAFHTATLLADGRVLVAGGNAGTWSYDGPFLASAEIYDPKTGKFSPTGSMATPRGWHTATLLADGRVLVAGGENARTDLTSAEIYDPKTGKFSPTGSMSVGTRLPRRDPARPTAASWWPAAAATTRAATFLDVRRDSTTRRPARGPRPARWRTSATS